MSQSSMPLNNSTTPAIRRIGNIPSKYLESDADDDDSDYDGEDMFRIDEDIMMHQSLDLGTLRLDVSKLILGNLGIWA